MTCKIETDVFDAEEIMPVKAGWYFCILNDGTPTSAYLEENTFWRQEGEQAVGIYHKAWNADNVLVKNVFVKYWSKLPIAKIE